MGRRCHKKHYFADTMMAEPHVHTASISIWCSCSIFRFLAFSFFHPFLNTFNYDQTHSLSVQTQQCLWQLRAQRRCETTTSTSTMATHTCAHQWDHFSDMKIYKYFLIGIHVVWTQVRRALYHTYTSRNTHTHTHTQAFIPNCAAVVDHSGAHSVTAFPNLCSNWNRII